MKILVQSKGIKILARSFSILGRLLIAVMFLALLFIVYQSIKYPDRAPSFLGYQPYTVLSNSMSPYIKTGDMVIIKAVSPSNVSANDVITFKDESGKIITHRVMEIKQNHRHIHFVTKGDNNNVQDDKMVADQNLIGKQVFLIPKGGYVGRFVSSPVGLILLVLLPLAGYLFIELYERMGKSAEDG